MDTSQFPQLLAKTYKQILEACLQDEAVETLKILENKDYLLQRINELFAEIYVPERERQIQQITLAYHKLLQENKKKPPQQDDSCIACEAIKIQMFALEKQNKRLVSELTDLAQYKQQQARKIDTMVLGETQELKNRIRLLECEITEKRSELEQLNSTLTQQTSELRLQLKSQRERSQEIISGLKQNCSAYSSEKQKLQKQVFFYLQQKGKQEKELREIHNRMTGLNIERQKLQTELGVLRDENTLLQEKIQRLEEEQFYLKQKTQGLQKENRNLRNRNSQLLQEFSSDKNQDNKVQSQWSSEVLDKCNRVLRINVELQKQNRDLKQQLENKTNQFSESSMAHEKAIIKLTQELKKTQAKYEKDLRQHREQLKSVRQTITTTSEESKEKEVSLITKRFEALLGEKEMLVARLTEQNKELNSNLFKSQEILSDLTFQYNAEKKMLAKQLEKEKQSRKTMKKHYSEGQASQELYQKQHSEQINSLQKERQELLSTIEQKEKFLKSLKKQLSQSNEQQQTQQMMISALQRKHDELSKNYQLQESNAKLLKDDYKQKQRALKQMADKYQSTLQEKQGLETQMSKMTKTNNMLQQKIKKLEQQLMQQRQIVLTLQEGNKQEVFELYEQTKMMSQESKKQLESYYLTLLKSQEEKVVHDGKRMLDKSRQEEIAELEQKNRELEDKMLKSKLKYSAELKQRETLEERMMHLFDELDSLKSQNKELIELLRGQKKENVKIIRAYQEKMMEYYRQFGQFKRQLYLNLREELEQIKLDLKTIVLGVERDTQKMKEYLAEFANKMAQQVQSLQIQNSVKIERMRHEYEFGVVVRLEDDKREAQLQSQLKLKEQSMEFYTILADKQHMITALEAKEAKQMNRISDLESKNQQLEKMARQGTKKTQELKEIISKMNNKVVQAERTANLAVAEIEQLNKSNNELKKEILTLQASFKEKIEKCRQTYSAQNERLFAKYQKQFSRFIASNKKGLDFSMLSGSKSSSNMLIPTKGCPNDGKLEQIQKQIEQQKRKLRLLEHGGEKGKMDKTFKMGVDCDTRKYDKITKK